MIQTAQIEVLIPASELEKLISGDVFGTRNGSVTIHFDNDGKIRKIEKFSVTFKT